MINSLIPYVLKIRLKYPRVYYWLVGVARRYLPGRLGVYPRPLALFYSIRAGNVVAVDLDPDAIRTARRIHSAPNVSYAVADIRTQLPEGPFDNIVWDASLEYFTAEELAQLLSNIKSRLRVGGVFSGCAMVKDVLSAQHRHLLRTKNDLLMLLKPHFKNVRVFETIYPSRHNVYFFAGEDVLPFDDRWPHQLVEH